MKPIFALLFAACATACAASTAEPGDMPEGPDAAAVTSPDSAPSAPDAAAPDAAPTMPAKGDAAPDSQALKADGGADSAPAMATPDARPDGRDGAASALPDAAPTGADAADARAVPPVCDAPADPSCANAQKADDEIRATFPQPCTGAERSCGGVIEDGHVVITYPMVCRDGAWRLAGSWYSGQWLAAYECSRGCGAGGVMCAP